MAASQSRWHSDGDRLQQWTAPVFPSLDALARRLHLAACWLSDIAWTDHPDYRAEHAFTRTLRMPVAAINHYERAFIASVLHARYGGLPEDAIKVAMPPLLDERATTEARSLGLALRLAYTLCGGALDLLAQTQLRREADYLTLELPGKGNLFGGETVQRRLDALGRSLGLAVRTAPRRNPAPALA
jgi:exopolyphosphatase/guanosine-5'-triphosphate,3'-diphosphate pyrophosphatase